jgi:EcoRII C terminal
MKQGYLSQYFDGVALKRLSAVEADETRSNQHEYNATKKMLEFIGRPSERTTMATRFLYLTDDEPVPIIEDAFLTLYDSRKGQANRSSEYRFYFPTTAVSLNAMEGDLLMIAKRREGGLLVIVAKNESSISRQIEWLFGFADELRPSFSVRSEMGTEQDRVGFASRIVLESIGIVVEVSDDNYLDDMIQRFGGEFPKTREFSDYARSTLTDLNYEEDKDLVLMACIEREEILFYTLERYIITDRLSKGFIGEDNYVDVDGFIDFSLSVQNRRKSRAGLALENHLEALFSECNIRYARNAITENKTKPDFLFPGRAEYHNPTFDPVNLTMLGVKYSCKDRWRQVLAEADRIQQKHLFTLEVSITVSQTNEMQGKNLQLVVPRKIHKCYTDAQQTWLMDISSFISLIQERQRIVG